MKLIVFLFFALVLLAAVSIWLILKSRNIHIWIIGYLKHKINLKPKEETHHKHVYVCLADHYEPFHGNVDQTTARKRVDDWCDNYPSIAKNHCDSFGRAPQHSYFYPEEEYDEYILNRIADMCKQGFGDLDIHLHHDNDTAENLTTTLIRFINTLHSKHGLLRKNENGDLQYGFIHGNWALANSRKDKRWCGVDNEIGVLLSTGCVFDMTLPSAPSDTQTSTVNSIYLAKERNKCKSHDKGKELSINTSISDDELLMIQGPLEFNWKSRKFGLIPRIESGELSSDSPSTEERVKLWESANISVRGAENHIFIKLHTHGVAQNNLQHLIFEGGLDHFWTHIETQFRDKENYSLHYVSAWEMYLKIKELANN